MTSRRRCAPVRSSPNPNRHDESQEHEPAPWPLHTTPFRRPDRDGHDYRTIQAAAGGSGSAGIARSERAAKPIDREAVQRECGIDVAQLSIDSQHRHSVGDRPDELRQPDGIVVSHLAGALLVHERGNERLEGTVGVLGEPGSQACDSTKRPNITR